jgi:hypothetical protein
MSAKNSTGGVLGGVYRSLSKKPPAVSEAVIQSGACERENSVSLPSVPLTPLLLGFWRITHSHPLGVVSERYRGVKP